MVWPLAAWMAISALGTTAAVTSSSIPYRAKRWWKSRTSPAPAAVPAQVKLYPAANEAPAVKVGGAAANTGFVPPGAVAPKGVVAKALEAATKVPQGEVQVFRPAIVPLENLGPGLKRTFEDF